MPDDLRNALTPAESDSLDAEEVADGILLKRSPAARRKAALRKIRAVQHRVRYTGTAPRPAADEEEEQIAEIVAADKLERRANRR